MFLAQMQFSVYKQCLFDYKKFQVLLTWLNIALSLIKEKFSIKKLQMLTC
jgi:hypothetical protein